MALRQVIVLEVTTAQHHDAPADWDWNALTDGGAYPEMVRVIAVGPELPAPEPEDDYADVDG